MKLFVMTSTRPGGFESTQIVYRIDDGRIKKIEKRLTEEPALLEFMTEIASTLEGGSVVEFCSKRNTFTNPYTEEWIVKWRQDQFAKRERWRQFDELIQKRQIQLAFLVMSDADLKSVLSPHRPDPPGTAIENPWAKPESPDDMLRHALGKKERVKKRAKGRKKRLKRRAKKIRPKKNHDG